ncbi:MAG: hypothetical protein HQL87_09775 [Magnetococcales bacterium]|nr:hypothetical protein [Magnetococcales bacterium]
MAHAITFNTLEFMETLKASGFDDVQAKGMTAAILKVQDATKEELATKGDLFEVKSELRADMKDLKSEIKADIAEVKADIKLMKWMMGAGLAGVAWLITMMAKLLVAMPH